MKLNIIPPNRREFKKKIKNFLSFNLNPENFFAAPKFIQLTGISILKNARRVLSQELKVERAQKPAQASV